MAEKTTKTKAKGQKGNWKKRPKFSRTQRVSIDLQNDPDEHANIKQQCYNSKFRFDYPNIRSQDLANDNNQWQCLPFEDASQGNLASSNRPTSNLKIMD